MNPMLGVAVVTANGTAFGTGLRYLGWRHFDDGTAEATLWFVILFLPVFPRKKHHVIVLSNPASPDSVKVGGVPFIYSTYSIDDEYRILGEGPLVVGEVLRTYLHAYLIIPILLFWPAPLLIWHMQYANGPYEEDVRNDGPLLLNMGLVLPYVMIYIPCILAHQLHLSRGARPRKSRLRKR